MKIPRILTTLLAAILLAASPAADIFAGEEVWVAVGYGGRRMVSTDGENWKITAEWAQPGGDDSNNLMGLVYAQKKFVAVGGGGGGRSGGGHVLISTDGTTWREVWEAPGRINPIVYGDGRFVVGGPRKQLYWSTDAETWTPGAKLEDKRCTHFRKGAFGNGLFVITESGAHSGPGTAVTPSRSWERIQESRFPDAALPSPHVAVDTDTDRVRELEATHYNATITSFDTAHNELWRIRLRPDREAVLLDRSRVLGAPRRRLDRQEP